MIQNSSDAAIGENGEAFYVHFNLGKFASNELNCQLEDIGDTLNRRFAQQDATYLEIRDVYTTGLTGCTRKDQLDPNDHGNYFKLIFDTGKEQTYAAEGMAGGSWGYGKSVYYRVGMGLVIFYSRIKTSEGYESRLIASLVEDETKSDSLLSEISASNIGRAWWGQRVNNEILPISDEKTIIEILTIFGLEPFEDDETGTSIVIPYIDSSALLKGLYPDDCVSAEELQLCSFKDSLEDYIRLSIQKWYAPRLFNKYLVTQGQKWLGAYVNEVPITNHSIRPLFLLVQELYNCALSENTSGNYKPTHFTDIKTIHIGSTKMNPSSAGTVAYITVDRSLLHPTISVYTMLRLFSRTHPNDTIVMFARNPGMILDYKIDGQWVGSIPAPQNTEECRFVFFVPNTKTVINQKCKVTEHVGKSFGEYLRGCEKSDHMDWNDPSSCNIVALINKQIIDKVNKEVAENTLPPVEGKASHLSGRLGRLLLPAKLPKHKGGSGGNGGSGGGSSSTSENLVLELDKAQVKGDIMQIPFNVRFVNNRTKAAMALSVVSESGDLDLPSWQENIGTVFPLSIVEIIDCKAYYKNRDLTIAFSSVCNRENSVISNGSTTISLITNEVSDKCGAFGIVNDDYITNVSVSGILCLQTTDRKISFSIKDSKTIGNALQFVPDKGILEPDNVVHVRTLNISEIYTLEEIKALADSSSTTQWTDGFGENSSELYVIVTAKHYYGPKEKHNDRWIDSWHLVWHIKQNEQQVIQSILSAQKENKSIHIFVREVKDANSYIYKGVGIMDNFRKKRPASITWKIRR